MDQPLPLAQQWRHEAAAYERDGQPGAALLRRVADELEAWTKRHQREELTLDQAAQESGFTKDHLARLIHDGKLTNVGEPRSPRVLRQDLPRKPGHRMVEAPDPIGDAQRLPLHSRS